MNLKTQINMAIFGFLLTLIVSIVAIIITWNVSNFFLARREFYVKSRYQILMIKLGWCASIGFVVFFIIFNLIVPKSERDILKKTNHVIGRFK